MCKNKIKIISFSIHAYKEHLQLQYLKCLTNQ